MRILYVLVTNKCTLSCRYCYYNVGLYQKTSSEINVDKLLKKIKPLSKYFDEVVFTGGEALLLKEIFLMASEFKKSGLITRIITNGTLLTPDVCKNIVSTFDIVDFSLDSLDSKQNNLTRGKSHIVKEGLNNLLRVRPKNLEIKILQTITAINYKSIEKMMKFCNERKIKLWLVPVDLNCNNPLSLKILNDGQIDNFKKIFHRWIGFASNNDKKEKIALNNYFNNIESLLQSKSIKVSCKMGVESFVLDPNGNIHACFYRKDLFFGNIYKDKLSQIMKIDSKKNMPLGNCVSLGCLCLTDF